MKRAGSFSKAGQWGGSLGKDFSCVDELMRFWVGRLRSEIERTEFEEISILRGNLEQIIAMGSSCSIYKNLE